MYYRIDMNYGNPCDICADENEDACNNCRYYQSSDLDNNDSKIEYCSHCGDIMVDICFETSCGTRCCSRSCQMACWHEEDRLINETMEKYNKAF